MYTEKLLIAGYNVQPVFIQEGNNYNRPSQNIIPQEPQFSRQNNFPYGQGSSGSQANAQAQAIANALSGGNQRRPEFIGSDGATYIPIAVIEVPTKTKPRLPHGTPQGGIYTKF